MGGTTTVGRVVGDNAVLGTTGASAGDNAVLPVVKSAFVIGSTGF